MNRPTHYASLVGPLLGLYYPLPFGDELQNRVALNTSRLKSLWCGIYDELTARAHIAEFGGQLLEDHFAQKLDYDHHEVSMIGGAS